MEDTSKQLEQLEQPEQSQYPKYKFSCGYIGPHPGFKEINMTLKGCPKCGAKAVKKIFKCEFCGKEFESSIRASKGKSCSECKVVAHRAYNKRYYDKFQEQKQTSGKNSNDSESQNSVFGIKAPKRKYDCVHYDDCMDINGRLINDPKACIGCSDYMPCELDVLDYVFQKSETIPIE